MPRTASPSDPSPRNGLLAFAAGVLLMCCAFLVLSLDGDTVDSLVGEDGPIEWVGAIGLFAGSALFLASFLVLRGRRHLPGPARIGVWSLLLMALVLFFFAGEEISWAQRLLGFGTPEALVDANAQNEANLHNVNVFQGTTLDGDRLFRIGWMTLFVLLPAAAWASARVRDLRARLLPVVTPLWLAGLFAMAWILTAVFTRVFEDGYTATYAIGSAGTEIQEATVEVLMGVSGLLTLLHVRSAADRDDAAGLAEPPRAGPHDAAQTTVTHS